MEMKWEDGIMKTVNRTPNRSGVKTNSNLEDSNPENSFQDDSKAAKSISNFEIQSLKFKANLPISN